MFAPTKTWRKWHRKINCNQRRYAVASALAATALPSLVMARGHKISEVPEIPLVLDASVESFQKTKQAIAALQKVGAYADVLKSKASRKIRAGKGKMRGRRHVQRRGPLVVYANDNGIVQSFRNLPGVDTCNVTRLNLLQLAPGGHLGRLIVWTQPAFEQLNAVFGTKKAESKQKKGYKLPYNIMTNSDITRLINSEEVQSVVRPANTNASQKKRLKKNPLKNLGALVKLNPYALTLRRKELLLQQARAAGKVKKTPRSKNHKRSTSLATYGRISAQDDAADLEAARLAKEEAEALAAAAKAEADERARAEMEGGDAAPAAAPTAADDEEEAPAAAAAGY
jgi:large subunit ribosomal protein L4e